MLLQWGNTGGAGGASVPWFSTPSVVTPPNFTLTRADAGTYFDSAGLLQTAAINAARGTYRYNGSAWVYDGLMVENAATNLALQSNSFNTTWGENSGVLTISQNATDPAGVANSAWTMTNSGGAFRGRFQTFALTNGVTYCLSVWIDKTGTPSSYPGILATSGTHTSGICFNTQTGSATAVTSYAARTPIVPVASGFTDETPTKYRAWYAFIANATTNFDVAMLPSFNSDGTGVANIAAAGSAVFSFFKLEVGSSPTSYTPTTTVAVARSADVLTATTSGILTGTQGFVAIGFRPISTPTTGNIIEATNLPMSLNAGQLSLNDGTAARDFLATSLTFGTNAKLATTWGGTTCNGAFNGTLGTSRTFDGDMGLGATITLMGGVSGVLQSLRFGARGATDSELAGWTT